MTTMHFTEKMTATPEQFIAALTDFGPGRSRIWGNSASDYLKVLDQGPRRRTSPRARAACGKPSTTTGPIPAGAS
jgi:hypothetical protein